MTANFDIRRFLINFSKKYLTWEFLKLPITKTIWTIFILTSLILVIFVPWVVQFILNTLFLITSFVVFFIIYVIVKIILALIQEAKN